MTTPTVPPTTPPATAPPGPSTHASTDHTTSDYSASTVGDHGLSARLITAYETSWRNGMAFLETLYTEQPNPYDLARALGEDRTKTTTWLRLANTYFAPTTFSRQQPTTRATATTHNISLAKLILIESYAKKTTTPTNAWALRHKLVSMTGTFEDIRTKAKTIIDETVEPTPPTPGVRISQTTHGMRTIHITSSEREITNLEKTLETIRTDIAPDTPRAQGLAEAFAHHQANNLGTITPSYTTVISVPLDAATKIITGHSDEVTLGLSDGTTMTGTDYLEAYLNNLVGDDLFVGLFSPVQGPVNAYKTRFANFKQRLLAKAENLICPWPECTVPADRCQVHHLIAHKHGGQTTPSNLSMACAYHNGINDDDRTAGHTPPPNQPGKRGKRGAPRPRPQPKPRGHLTRHHGKVTYQSPSGKRYANTHPCATLGAMHHL